MEDQGFENQEVRLTIRQLGTPANAPGVRNVVVLGDEFQRALYILIGACEALAILRRLEEADLPPAPQPLAHDLLMAVCETLGARVEKVVIDDLWNDTYYSKIHLFMDGEHLTIDARPSDAIALALRADAPLYASEAVMLAAARSQEESG